MFTGRDAVFSVEQAISRVRADESRLDAALRSAVEEAARHRSEEADGFRVLARIRLDTLMRQRVIGDLDASERRALALIENHRRNVEALARQRDEAQAALDKAEADKHARDTELAQALDALDRQRQRTAERIEPQAAWREAKAAVEAAKEIAENAERKASVSEADLGAKRKPYEDDPLFMYLWNRRHNRADDTSGFLVRFFDRKVARLIGYHDARANYAMLLEIPTRLREHATAKQEDVSAASDRLAAFERRALVEDGIEPVEAKAEAAQAAVRAAADQVLSITAELERIEAERQKAVGSGDEDAYADAVEVLAQALAREDLQQLYNEALRTPTPKDEQTVDAIARARRAAEQADAEVAQIRGQIRDAAARRNELEGARDRARRGGFDDPRGTIGGATGGAVIAEVIDAILRGAARGDLFDDVLRDNYRRPRPRSDPDFGGRRSGPWWPGPLGDAGGGSPWGGSPWGGGGSGGSSDDGGWRTGGSFFVPLEKSEPRD